MNGILIIDGGDAWHADSWEEVAEALATSDGQTPGLKYLTLEEVDEMCEDGIALPDSALEIARAQGTVCEVQRGHDDLEYVAPQLAPTLADVVTDWLRRDYPGVIILDNRPAALAWLENQPAGALRDRVRKCAWALAWVEDDA